MAPDDLYHRRETALELLDVATDGETGRGETDPVYRAITEGAA